jgi:hypothetical protein
LGNKKGNRKKGREGGREEKEELPPTHTGTSELTVNE